MSDNEEKEINDETIIMNVKCNDCGSSLLFPPHSVKRHLHKLVPLIKCPNIDDLENKKVKELRQIAKDKELKGYSYVCKPELIYMIKNNKSFTKGEYK